VRRGVFQKLFCNRVFCHEPKDQFDTRDRAEGGSVGAMQCVFQALRSPFQERAQNIFLCAEVIEECPFGDLGRVCDFLNGRLMVALIAKKLDSSVEKSPACIGLLVFASG